MPQRKGHGTITREPHADMRIFVGYGYNERDRWIEDYVVPLVVAFGCEVVHGKSVYGGALPDEVMKAIRTSDAVIGFTTLRESVAPGQYRTHDWVAQELLTAHARQGPTNSLGRNSRARGDLSWRYSRLSRYAAD
jgi:hypothetical protein